MISIGFHRISPMIPLFGLPSSKLTCGETTFDHFPGETQEVVVQNGDSPVECGLFKNLCELYATVVNVM